MDRILIEALSVDTVIGVYDWERSIQQSLSLDLVLATDIRSAAATDDLRLTLDYAAICQRIQQFADAHQFALVETFAERLAECLRTEFPISWLRLTVRKPGRFPTPPASAWKLLAAPCRRQPRRPTHEPGNRQLRQQYPPHSAYPLLPRCAC
ncbi:hypothetical protein HORIV_51500 [Vreelandella olivaria]|uniref:7,8-dihydroneopterin aldolase n=1 Tax=Vreelandella olivaria TaxID=390919 RepID=A0ABM7GNX3_9GAMM|nr:hypothetical protein HORIV_51500 [Halomonas olivaria]